MGRELTGVKLELMVDNGATPMKVDNGQKKSDSEVEVNPDDC